MIEFFYEIDEIVGSSLYFRKDMMTSFHHPLNLKIIPKKMPIYLLPVAAAFISQMQENFHLKKTRDVNFFNFMNKFVYSKKFNCETGSLFFFVLFEKNDF